MKNERYYEEKHKAEHCPICDSDDINVIDRDYMDVADEYGNNHPALTEHFVCSECKARWDVDYVFDSVNTVIKGN